MGRRGCVHYLELGWEQGVDGGLQEFEYPRFREFIPFSSGCLREADPLFFYRAHSGTFEATTSFAVLDFTSQTTSPPSLETNIRPSLYLDR